MTGPRRLYARGEIACVLHRFHYRGVDNVCVYRLGQREWRVSVSPPEGGSQGLTVGVYRTKRSALAALDDWCERLYEDNFLFPGVTS